MNYDIGSLINVVLGRIPETITAGAGNDNVEINGPSHDRRGTTSLYHSLEIALIWSATLAEAATLTLLANMQDSADNSAWADLGSATSGPGGGSEILALTTVATGPSGGGTVNGVTRFSVDIRKARRYLRLQSTANLSAAMLDTVDVAAALIFGNASQLPAA